MWVGYGGGGLGGGAKTTTETVVCVWGGGGGRGGAKRKKKKRDCHTNILSLSDTSPMSFTTPVSLVLSCSVYSHECLGFWLVHKLSAVIHVILWSAASLMWLGFHWERCLMLLKGSIYKSSSSWKKQFGCLCVSMLGGVGRWGAEV